MTDENGEAKRYGDRKVRALFNHFDVNSDGHLSYPELRRLQLETSGDDLDGPTFVSICESLRCNPRLGLTLEALRSTYEGDDDDDDGDGADIDKDYEKIFGKRATTSVVHELDGDDEFANVFRELVKKDGGGGGDKTERPAQDEPAVDKLRIGNWQKKSSSEEEEASSSIRTDSDLDGDYYKSFSGGDGDEVYNTGSAAVLPTGGATAAGAIQKSCMFSLPKKLVPSLALPTVPSPTHVSRILFGTSGGRIVSDSPSKLPVHDEEGDTESDGDEADHEGSGLIAFQSAQSPKVKVDDRVRALHRFFDVDDDGRLDYCELRNLQLRTSGEDIDTEEYRLICIELDVDPREGLTEEALQQTYSSGDGNIKEDYTKVFPSESVAAMFLSSDADGAINIRGDYPYLAAERLEKVSLLFNHFDADKNGLLSYSELRQLQYETSGEVMDGVQYMTICQLYKCDPHEGLKLENLCDLYLSQNTDSSLDEDYRKVYRKYVWSVTPRRGKKEKGEVDDCNNTKKDQQQEFKENFEAKGTINGKQPDPNEAI